MGTEKLNICDFYQNLDYDLPHFKNQIFTRTATREFETPVEGKLEGKIPKWLNGILISNGPGKYTVGDHKLNHHYDGLGMLQKFQINSDGKITYQNKFVQSEAHVRGCKENRVIFNELGTRATANPSTKVLNKLMSWIKPDVTDNTNITIAVINDEFYATSDTSKVNKINLSTLEKIEMVDMDQKFKISSNCSHFHTTKDGTVYSLGSSFTPAGAYYNIIEIPRKGEGIEKGKIVGKMNATSKFNPCLMHSFGMTENYFIIIETPLRISIIDHLKNGVNSLSIHEGLRWKSEEPAKFHLINRKSGKRQHTFHSDPFMNFHIPNQYEKDDHVVIDVICYLNDGVFDINWIEKLHNDDPERSRKNHANVLRFVLPLNNKSIETNLIKLENTKAHANLIDGKVYCTPELMLGFGCEFPAINYTKYSGVEYKFLYVKGRDGSAIKINLETKEKVFWREEDFFLGEPVFVASPDGRDEDDGVIVVTFIRLNDSNITGLIILDGKSFKEVARCEFNLGSEVPMSFHSVFIKK